MNVLVSRTYVTSKRTDKNSSAVEDGETERYNRRLTEGLKADGESSSVSNPMATQMSVTPRQSTKLQREQQQQQLELDSEFDDFAEEVADMKTAGSDPRGQLLLNRCAIFASRTSCCGTSTLNFRIE